MKISARTQGYSGIIDLSAGQTVQVEVQLSVLELISTAISNAPTNLELSNVGNEITLTWDDNSYNEDGFIIERWDSTNGWVVIDTVPPNTIEYINLIN